MLIYLGCDHSRLIFRLVLRRLFLLLGQARQRRECRLRGSDQRHRDAGIGHCLLLYVAPRQPGRGADWVGDRRKLCCAARRHRLQVPRSQGVSSFSFLS